MKRRIFRRIFILYVIVLLLSVIFIEFYITSVVRANHLNYLKKSLSIQASLISEKISFTSQTSLDRFCRQMKEKTGARVTVIDANGNVMGDSDNDSTFMENHADRPEIQQSLLTDTGWSIRHSDTLQYELLYTAIKVMRGETLKGFIRLSVPLREVNKSINILRLKINLAVILLFLFTGILLIWQTERIRKFVARITDFSKSLAQGSLEKRLFLQGAGEFNELAQNLNEMSTKLKESIDRRAGETDRLNVILKSIPDALLLININGTIELSNNAARELFGDVQLAKRPFIEVLRNPEFFSLIDEVKQKLSSGLTELTIDYPEERYMMVRVSPLFYKESELSGFVAIFHDTTHLKKLEQMRKDFVANVSHEIKTPVTAIKGFTETLLDGAIDERDNALRFLKTIKSHSERLNRLVDDLLTLSKIELGVIKIHKTDVYISDIIDTVIETLKDRAIDRGLYLRKSHQTEKIKIKADRDRTMQILLNLVDNAIKFTNRGGIEIGIDTEDDRNYIFVKDTGIGIPKKYLSRLGERFFRVDPSRSRELGGTGLGLAIVKHLAKAHEWNIKIESSPGKGTKVMIMLSVTTQVV